MRCALCGRKMASPAVTIGDMPIGPKCARRAGLIEVGRKRSGLVRLVNQKYIRDDQLTMDLFEDEAQRVQEKDG